MCVSLADGHVWPAHSSRVDEFATCFAPRVRSFPELRVSSHAKQGWACAPFGNACPVDQVVSVQVARDQVIGGCMDDDIGVVAAGLPVGDRQYQGATKLVVGGAQDAQMGEGGPQS